MRGSASGMLDRLGGGFEGAPSLPPRGPLAQPARVTAIAIAIALASASKRGARRALGASTKNRFPEREHGVAFGSERGQIDLRRLFIETRPMLHAAQFAVRGAGVATDTFG